MSKNKILLLAFALLSLNGCSSVTGIFEDDDRPPLEGERLSVLELQKTLTPDGDLNSAPIILPTTWVNEIWPQAGGYPNHSMQNLSFSTEGYKKIWSADIGTGSSSALPLNARPIVANNMVFTLDTRSNLSAFDAQTGKKVWNVNIEKDKEDEVVVSGGIGFAYNTLYATNGFDELIAISPQDGKLKWRKRLPAPSRAAPTIIGGRVFISTIDNRLVALDAKDGTGLWEYIGLVETTGLLGAASPGANNDIVVPAFSSGEVTALRLENGSVAWSDNLSNVRKYGGGLESLSDIRAMPILDRGIVIAISFGGKLAAIDERTGTRLWQREISGIQTPWVAGNNLYVLGSDNQLIALNITDGSIFWITELQNFENEKKKKNALYWNGPLMAQNKLIVTSSHGQLLEIDPKDGRTLKTVKLREKTRIPPVIANNTLYILSEDGTLIAYR